MNKKDILNSILTSPNVDEEINNNLDLLLEIIPEIKYMINFLHNHPHHHLDVFNHTLLALSKSNNNFEIRLCLLLHDIGKPFSYQEKDGIRHFNGHPKVSSNMARIILERLEYDEEFIDEVCYLIRKHDDMITRSEVEENPILSYKRYLIQEADALAHHPEKLEKRKEYLKRTRSLF